MTPRPVAGSATMVAQRDFKEKFPNPPLREVAYEIRFPADLRIPHEIYKFQENIRDRLPRVGKAMEISLGAPGVLPTLVEGPWLFEDNEGNLQVKVGIQSFAVISRKHKSFETLMPPLKDMTTHFVKAFSIASVNRVGLRYVNDIVLGTNPLNDLRIYFPPVLHPDVAKLEDVVSASVEVRQKRGQRFLTLRTSFQADPQGASHYLIDIDSYHEGKEVPTDAVFGLVGELHDNIIREFHRNITDRYVERLRGGDK